MRQPSLPRTQRFEFVTRPAERHLVLQNVPLFGPAHTPVDHVIEIEPWPWAGTKQTRENVLERLAGDGHSHIGFAPHCLTQNQPDHGLPSFLDSPRRRAVSPPQPGQSGASGLDFLISSDDSPSSETSGSGPYRKAMNLSVTNKTVSIFGSIFISNHSASCDNISAAAFRPTLREILRCVSSMIGSLRVADGLIQS